MRILWAFMIFWISTGSLQAQKIIQGTVANSLDEPLPGSVLKLYRTEGETKKLLGFSISDPLGKYQISLPPTGRSFVLEANAVGYAAVSYPFIRENDTSVLEKKFRLSRSLSFLDTVRIDYSFKVRVRGDTISFNPQAFSLGNENNLEQLIGRLPGIEITETGKIFFNGYPINSVLINGDDLFRNNYQELTRNASPEIVETIEVIQNYQRDKLLKDKNITEGQVLNLKLKKKYSRYTFGHLNGQVDNRRSWMGEAFGMHLQQNLKAELRINGNTIGNPSSSARSGFEAEPQLNETRVNIIPYQSPEYRILTDKYIARDIPSIYQNFNVTKEISQNLLIKLPRKWELTSNLNWSTDSFRRHQTISYSYPNAPVMYRESYNEERIRSLRYHLGGSKIENGYSFYFDLRYHHNIEQNKLLVHQNLQPPSHQLLNNRRDYLSGNLNYNRKLNTYLLWVSSFSHNSEDFQQRFNMDSSFLFWKFPTDHLYSLKSRYANELIQNNFKSGLYHTKGKNDSQFEFLFQSEKLRLQSGLSAERNGEIHTFDNFTNDNKLLSTLISARYALARKINEKNHLALTAQNVYRQVDQRTKQNSQNYHFWLPYYSLGYTYRLNAHNHASLSLSLSKKLPFMQELYKDSIVSNSNTVVIGYKYPYTTQSYSLELKHILTNFVKQQWLSFTVMRMNLLQDNFIRSFYTNGVFNQHDFTFYPNRTQELSILHSSQKLINPLSLHVTANASYLYKNLYSLNNGVLQYSHLQFISGQFGMKSVFKSPVNFEITSSLSTQVAYTIKPSPLKNRNQLTNQKLSFYYVPAKTFHLTALYQYIAFQSAKIRYGFLDLNISKKWLQETLHVELKGRNLLNRKAFTTTIISPFYIEQDRISLIGRQLLISVKYLFR